MWKRNISGRRLLVQLYIVMIAVTIICLVICGVYSYRSVREELSYCNEAELDVFYNGLRYTINDLESFNRSIYSDESILGLLSTQSSSELVESRIMAEWMLREISRNRTSASTGIYFFRDDDSFSFYHLSESFLNRGEVIRTETVQLLKRIRTFWEEQTNPPLRQWVIYSEGDTVLLMNAERRNGLFSCAMIDLNAYTRSYRADGVSSGIEYVFFDDDNVLTNVSYVEKAGLDLDALRHANGSIRQTNTGALILHSRYLDSIGLGLCGIISMSGIWANQYFLGMILFAIVLFITSIFTTLYMLMRRMLIYPLDKIAMASRQIAEGATEIERHPESIQELEAIQAALEGLVEQKVSLERESISQAYQKEHAMLQYYQLQTRSHFFLNCLKSIYNMVAREELEKTLRVITLFSNHLRYVFLDGLSLIPVRAELAEANDYYHIIELERSDHILLTQEIAPELMDFPVPPLIIQTFLENFNKHNAQADRILRFIIRVDRLEMEERPFVRIRLSDNGVGYDKDALKDMGRRNEVFAQYHVGIQNLLRRLDILYQDRYQIAFYNNPGGGASSVIYIPYDSAEASAPLNAPGHQEGTIGT